MRGNKCRKCGADLIYKTSIYDSFGTEEAYHMICPKCRRIYVYSGKCKGEKSEMPIV